MNLIKAAYRDDERYKQNLTSQDQKVRLEAISQIVTQNAIEDIDKKIEEYLEKNPQEKSKYTAGSMKVPEANIEALRTLLQQGHLVTIVSNHYEAYIQKRLAQAGMTPDELKQITIVDRAQLDTLYQSNKGECIKSIKKKLQQQGAGTGFFVDDEKSHVDSVQLVLGQNNAKTCSLGKFVEALQDLKVISPEPSSLRPS